MKYYISRPGEAFLLRLISFFEGGSADEKQKGIV